MIDVGEDSFYEKVFEGTQKYDISDAIDEGINKDHFRLFVSAIIETQVDDETSSDQLIQLLSEASEQANSTLNTDYDTPSIKKRNIKNRVKECAQCRRYFFDITKRNQSKTCQRIAAYGTDGKAQYRNGVRLTECYRQHRLEYYRKDDEYSEYTIVDSPESRVVNADIGKFADKIDSSRRIVSSPRKRTESIDGEGDYGTNGGMIRMPIEKAIVGVFHEDGTIKDREKYDSLPKWVKDSVESSRVEKYNVFNRDWDELDSGLQKVYGSRDEFQRMKRKRVSA